LNMYSLREECPGIALPSRTTRIKVEQPPGDAEHNRLWKIPFV
jgi:hypothetical protein